MSKKSLIRLAFAAAVLLVGIILINLDIAHWETAFDCRFKLEPDKHSAGLYHLEMEGAALKPGKYTLTLTGNLGAKSGPQSSVRIDDTDGEILLEEIFSGGEENRFEFEVQDRVRRIRIHILYNPASGAISVNKAVISTNNVLYKENVIRHAKITVIFVLICTFLYFAFRFVFPKQYRNFTPALDRKITDLLSIFSGEKNKSFLNNLSDSKKKAVWIIAAIVICISAILLYKGRITYTTSFVNDEFQSASAAYNFANGNGLVSTDSYSGPRSYTRAWPATILLAAWIKIWGTSEAAFRSLSAVYGILFLISVLYITKRMFGSIGYSVIAALFCVAESTLLEHFCMTRMYSLEMLLVVWMYYFIYKLLEGNQSSKAKQILYAAAAVILSFFAYETHVNAMVPLIGVALFIFIQAIVTKQKKYWNLIIAGIAVFLACIGNIAVYYQTGKFLFLKGVFKNFLYYASSINWKPDYLIYLLDLTGNRVLSVILLLIVLIGAIKNRKIDKKVVYLFCLTAFTAVFMSLFTVYQFIPRYIMMVIPFAIGIYSYAYIIVRDFNRTIAAAAGLCLLFFIGSTINSDIYKYNNTDNKWDTNYVPAYQSVYSFYDEDEEIPILQQMMRTWYGDKVFDRNKIKVGRLERENSVNSWLTFAENYPDGIVTCERLKMDFISQSAQDIILNWTDRLSGDYIDRTGVNVSHYLFVTPAEYENSRSLGTDGVTDAYDGNSLRIEINPEEVKNYFGMEELPRLLLLQLNLGEQNTRYVQLVIPEEESRNIVYNIPWDDLRRIETAPETMSVNRSRMAAWNQTLYTKE